MQMFTLSPDQSVPEGANWLAITSTPTGRYAVFGCLANSRDVAVVNNGCKSYETAKFLGWQWAEENGVDVIYLNEAGASVTPVGEPEARLRRSSDQRRRNY